MVLDNIQTADDGNGEPMRFVVVAPASHPHFTVDYFTSKQSNLYYYWKRPALWTFPYFNHLKYLVYRLDIQKCQIRGFSNRSTQCIDLSLQQHWLPRGPRSTRRSVLSLTYLSSQWTIFPKETFFLEKLSLEQHKMMEISTKTFALWEFFVDIFIISYCYVFQKQQQEFSLCDARC